MDRLEKLLAPRPRWSINRRAAEIGAVVSRKKELRWTADEDALLQRIAWQSPGRITATFREHGFRRTMTAIAVRLKRFHVREKIDSMTAQGLAQMLGIDVHGVMRWIDLGWLRAERSGTRGDNHDRWHITTDAAREFLLAHPEQYELSKLERAGSRMWYLELVTSGLVSEDGAPRPAAGASSPAGHAPGALLPERTFALCGERVSLAALAQISGRTAAEILERVDGRGMSVENAAFGADAAPKRTLPTQAARAVGQGLRALLVEQRRRPIDVARQLEAPPLLVRRMLEGSLSPFHPLLLSMLAALEGAIEVDIRQQKKRRAR
jgi:hypothetical protein